MRNYKRWLVFSKYWLACWLVFGLTTSAHGVVNADRTRVIFSASDMAQSLNLSNDGATPALVQVWTDLGDPRVPPDKVSTPVIVTPPVFKMQPHEIRSLRLLLTARQSLPADKESVFWLNIFQIQPESEQARKAGQKVVLPLRLRMKVFIRPAGLGAPDNAQYQRLQFSARNGQLQITNPTAWYMSLEVQLVGQQAVSNLMVAPEGQLSVPLPVQVKPGQQLNYRVITDDGNSRNYQGHIAR
jgi:P pilus assembly chaperone PapD